MRVGAGPSYGEVRLRICCPDGKSLQRNSRNFTTALIPAVLPTAGSIRVEDDSIPSSRCRSGGARALRTPMRATTRRATHSNEIRNRQPDRKQSERHGMKRSGKARLVLSILSNVEGVSFSCIRLAGTAVGETWREISTHDCRVARSLPRFFIGQEALSSLHRPKTAKEGRCPSERSNSPESGLRGLRGCIGRALKPAPRSGSLREHSSGSVDTMAYRPLVSAPDHRKAYHENAVPDHGASRRRA